MGRQAWGIALAGLSMVGNPGVVLLIGPMTTRLRECQPAGFLEWIQTVELCTAGLGLIFSVEVHFTIKGMKL